MVGRHTAQEHGLKRVWEYQQARLRVGIHTDLATIASQRMQIG